MNIPKHIHKIVLHKGDIETLGYFSKQLSKSFINFGYPVYIIDFEQELESIKGLAEFIEPGATAFVTFNYTGLIGEDFLQVPNHGCVWDVAHVYCINIVVDHPFYYHRFLPMLPKLYFQYCIDKDHLAYMNRFFPHISCGFLPLAGTQLLDSLIPFEDRTIDVIFTGNYTPPSTFEKDITRINDEYTAFYYSIINDLIDNPDMPMEQAFEKHLRLNMENATEEEIRDSMPTLIFLDLYVRNYYRGKIIRTLIDSNIKVHVFGAGWDRLECKHPENMICGGNIDSEECLEHICNAKISLNVMPWFKNGAHDRIFNTMLNGAVCVTDDSIYLREQLNPTKDVIFYSLKELNKLPEIINNLLAHPDFCKDLISHGYETAKKSHTWNQRAMDIDQLFKGIQ